MKIICGKEELVEGLNVVLPAVAQKISLPQLSNVLFEASKGNIRISATDLDIGVKTFIKGNIVKEGATTIPAKKLSEIIRELPSAEVEIEGDKENRISVKCQTADISLMGLSKDEFPTIPEFKEDKSFTIRGDVMKEGIRKTIFAVSTDETRYILNGIYLFVEKGNVKFVATDGKRLACFNSEVDIDKKLSVGVVIPTKAISELQKITNDDVRISISPNQVGFRVKDTTLISRVVEGKFPNYEQVIPKEHHYRIKINRQELLTKTKIVSVVSSEKTSSVKYIFGNNRLQLLTSAQGGGVGKDELKIEFKEDAPIETAYNPVFVIDVLKNIDTENIVIELTNPLNPGVIKPEDKNDYLCVIMPMRVG